MNKSEIAEKAAREITHYFLEPDRETRMEQHIKPISAIVERAIAESQAPQPRILASKLREIPICNAADSSSGWNRYDTDDQYVLHVWTNGKSYDLTALRETK